MIEKVYTTIIKHNLIQSGDRVLCAVSGGADSVALLLCLLEIREKLGFTLSVAHFHHGIRGDEADKDEQFVRELCENMSVEYICGKSDVPAYAKQMGYTLEQAGRILRYDFLESLPFDKIAVAHHMDDQAESVLMHIIRGSGTHGISGMRYMRGKIIRPLLNVRRYEIEHFLCDKGVSFCTDSTNLTEDGTRNKLRLRIIPEITEMINPSFTEALCHMADIVRCDDDYLSGLALQEMKKSRKGDGFDRNYLSLLPEPVKRRVLRFAMEEAGAYADIEQKHADAVEKLLTAETGAHLDLPHICVDIKYDKICFSKAVNCDIIEANENTLYTFGEGTFTFGRKALHIDCVQGNNFTADEKTAFMDADKIPQDAVVRLRQPGDRISPVGFGGTKKLKDFFIDRKVLRDERDIPLICSGHDVLCIVGMCVAKSVAVSEKTVKMYRIIMEDI